MTEVETPLDRDRSVDGLRALAILGVVVGHWTVGALVLGGGGLTVDSPLRALPQLGPASWVLQMLGLFFLVGGWSSARGLRHGAARGEGYGSWLRRRLIRLGRPVVAAVLLWAATLAALGVAGAAPDTVRSGAVLFLQPLWFVGVYLAVNALTPLLVAADGRWGWRAALPGVGVVALVDAARYGPWADVVPGWVGLVSVLPGWAFAYQLGVSWERRPSRGWAVGLLLGGAALVALLVTVGGYPASMVGVPGEGRTNAHPPSLLVPALAAAQCGAAMLLRGRLHRLLLRPRWWRAAVLPNVAAMSILCWHQPVAVLVASAAATAGGVTGLTDVPNGAGWLLARAVWLPVLAVVLAAVCVAVRRWEPRPGARDRRRRPGQARSGLRKTRTSSRTGTSRTPDTRVSVE